jgi:hypothetical protein
MAVASQPTFSCTIGDYTFSNFDYQYLAGLTTGCGGASQPTCPSSPSTPSPSTQITVNFDILTSGTDADGTVASVSHPIVQVITDYSGGNTVNQFQTETGMVQYFVTDNNAGDTITEVDAGLTGVANSPASGSLSKYLCAGSQFGGGTVPNGSCVGHTEDQVTAGLALTAPAQTVGDSSKNYQPISLSSAGVYDGWSINGNSAGAATASVTAVENDFIESVTTGTPEPGTFVLLGGALVGLGALRRRKKSA